MKLVRPTVPAVLLMIVTSTAMAQPDWPDRLATPRSDELALAAEIEQQIHRLIPDHGSLSATWADSVWHHDYRLLTQDLHITTDILKGLAKTGDPSTRRAAAWLLGRVPGSQVLRFLESLVHEDSDPAVRRAALEGLLAGRGFLQVCEVLNEGATLPAVVEHSNARNQWLSALADLPTGGPSPSFTSPRAAPVRLGDAKQRASTLARLHGIEDRIIDASSGEAGGIRSRLGRPSISYEARDAAWLLGPGAGPLLAERAWHENGYRWSIAQRLLQEMGTVEVVEPLRAVMTTHEEAYRRAVAFDTLWSASQASQLLDVLKAVVEVGSETEARWARDSLAACRVQGAPS